VLTVALERVRLPRRAHVSILRLGNGGARLFEACLGPTQELAAVTETQDGDVGVAGETDALECDGEHWRITLLFSERSGEVFGALLLRGARQPLPLAVQRAIAQRLEQVRPSQRPARRAGGSAPS
jgi:hypothetical protein